MGPGRYELLECTEKPKGSAKKKSKEREIRFSRLKFNQGADSNFRKKYNTDSVNRHSNVCLFHELSHAEGRLLRINAVNLTGKVILNFDKCLLTGPRTVGSTNQNRIYSKTY